MTNFEVLQFHVVEPLVDERESELVDLERVSKCVEHIVIDLAW